MMIFLLWKVERPLQLIDNRLDEETLASQLDTLLSTAQTVYIHVAYLRSSGVALLREQFKHLAVAGGIIRILAGGDFAQTEPNALQFFRELGGNCEVRLVTSSGVEGFHPKCYLVYSGETAALIIGSSNFTSGGLQGNIELNVRLNLPVTDRTILVAQQIFENLWKQTPPLTERVFADYTRFWTQYRQAGAGFIYRLPEEEQEMTGMTAYLDPAELEPGDIVRFNEQEGEVMSVTRIGDRWQVRLSVEGSGTRNLLSPPTHFQRVDSPLARAKRLDFDTPIEFDLLTEATRLSLAYEHDRLVSLSNSRTNLEPYQVAAVHKVIQAWEQRFLIADDVGLGKTVETGMVVKELKARHRAERTLIICPAGLALQWQREMSEKFDEQFDVLSSSGLRQWRSTRPAGEPLSMKYPRAIVSIDTAKPREDENNSPDFTEAHWDIVIIDEAHKVAQHGQGEQLISRFKLARDIAPACDSLLLLSATPHDGDPNAFHSLLDLLDPLRFPSADTIKPSDLEPMMVRRGKADIRKDDGTPLFPPRWVETTEVNFTPEELHLYNEVTDYVREGYRTAAAMKNTAVGFLMVLLQKRMVSSIAAIRRSLERRIIALEHPEAAVLSPAELRELKERDADEESLTDRRREELQRKLEAARLRLNTAEHQDEIRQVRTLHELAKSIHVDSKARELREFVAGVLNKAPGEKILIFTEYTDTLDYLRDEVLKDFGPMAQIYGGMDMIERQEQEENFRKPEVHLMVATDAAGEGLNLQFAHIMINYELPWNPNRIEQRIGRLHRYGQEHTVRVYNLQVMNTREGIILASLLQKIKIIEQQLGGYAPNVLGLTAQSEMVNLNKLSDLIMNAIADDTPPEVTAEHVVQALEARREMSEQLENDLFMPLHKFNKGETDRLISRSREMTPSNADIEAFVRRYFETHGGKIENTRRNHVYRLRTPKRLIDGKTVLDEYPIITFDKETAFKSKHRELQFIAFGHPLLESIVRDCRCRTPKLSGAVTVKHLPDSIPGILFTYLLRYSDAQDQTLSEELFPVFVTSTGKVELKQSRDLLHAPGHPVEDTEQKVSELVVCLDEYELMARQTAQQQATNEYTRVQELRTRQADACISSLESFQRAKKYRLEGTILTYQQRILFGEDMDIAIRRVESEINRLSEDCERRLNDIERKRHVQANAPELLNLAFVIAE